MNKAAIRKMVQQAEECLGPYCTCRGLEIHGFSHLRRVAVIAGRIATATGQDVESAVVAGFLHDCARRHEGGGAGHAHDSADLAQTLLPMFYPHLDLPRLCDAIARHADGQTTSDMLAACLWDADRLELRRLDIDVDPNKLSTEIARRLVSINRCRESAKSKA